MKKSFIPGLILVVIVLIIGLVFFFINREYPDDENTLYTIKFDNVKIRVERYDYSLGQNQIVGVEKSTNNGKSYQKITKEPINVSMEPEFIFLNEKLGFILSKPNLSKSNNYSGLKVTQDGGKTFTDAIINYDNPNIDIITFVTVPYKIDNELYLELSITQVKADQSGYEDVKLLFNSTDNGLTWNYKE